MWSIDDNKLIFEALQTSNGKSIDEFLNVYPSVISTYEKSRGSTVREQDLAYEQALEKLDGLIALAVHIRDSDVCISFISPSAGNLLCCKYNFEKIDNYTAYCKTDTEYVFVFTDIALFKSYILPCIRQCKHKKRIILALNDSIEEYDGKLGISPIPIHYTIDIDDYSNISYDDLDELFS